MGAQPSRPESPGNYEYTPLIPEPPRDVEAIKPRLQERSEWGIRHTMLLMFGLVVFVTMILICVFFGSKPPVVPQWLWNLHTLTQSLWYTVVIELMVYVLLVRLAKKPANAMQLYTNATGVICWEAKSDFDDKLD